MLTNICHTVQINTPINLESKTTQNKYMKMLFYCCFYR
jgi:hypothetical protein